MQSIDDQELFLLSQANWLFLTSFLGDGYGKPFFEVITAVEDLG